MLWQRGATAVLAALFLVVALALGAAGASDLSDTGAGADAATYGYDERVHTATGSGSADTGETPTIGTNEGEARAASGDVGCIYDFDRSLVAPGSLVDDVASSGLWSRSSFNGTRVYQWSDLIDPGFVDDIGRSNLRRVQSGLAPIGPDGRSINLYHTWQTDSSAIAEVTQTFHQVNSSVIHINPSSIPSGIDRTASNALAARLLDESSL